MANRAFLALGLLLSLAACANLGNSSNPGNPGNSSNPSNPTQGPSCLPAGYRPCAPGEAPSADAQARGEELDVMLAVVEGEVITKRRLAREAGGLAKGQDPEVLNAQLHRRLKERARLLLFVREAMRAGVVVRDSMLDSVVESELSKRTKEAAETIGSPVTVQAYLADQGMTLDEFRERVREQLQYQAYVIRLKEGLGGPTRPQVDMDVSPAEVRRIYWSHPGAFDEKSGVRFAYFQVIIENYESDDVSFLDAEELAMADAEKLAEGFRQGVPPETLAERFRIDEGLWLAAAEDEFASPGGRVQMLGPDANEWLFADERKTGDATVLTDATGVVVFGMLEKKQGRRIPYDEAYDKIVRMVQFVRERRLIEEKLIEILSTRTAVQPPQLAAELLSDARKLIQEIDSDPVFAAAKFR